VIRAAKTLPARGYDIDEMVATGYREYDDLAGRLFGNFLGEVESGRSQALGGLSTGGPAGTSGAGD
jgi:hypothetical protein